MLRRNSNSSLKSSLNKKLIESDASSNSSLGSVSDGDSDNESEGNLVIIPLSPPLSTRTKAKVLKERQGCCVWTVTYFCKLIAVTVGINLMVRAAMTWLPNCDKVAKNAVNVEATNAAKTPQLRSASPLTPEKLVEKKTVPAAPVPPPAAQVPHEMEVLVDDLARVWQPYTAGNPMDYCIDKQFEKEHLQGKYGGIIYAKLYKTGSTTGAAATLHMAHRIAQRLNKTEPCRTQVDHPFSIDNKVPLRANARYSALWSSVRQPHYRALSAYYFYRVGFERKQPQDKDMIKFMDGQRNNQFIQLRTNRTIAAQGMVKVKAEQQVDHLDPAAWADILRTEIMPTYDFLAITERMEESLVALKLLWGLQDGDMILYPGKTGEWSHDWGHRGTCFRTPKSKTKSPHVWDWIRSNFTAGNADYLLYAVAERSLDLTIETHWGRDAFDQQVAKHRALKAVALERCQGKAIFPCSETGEWQEEHKQDCYMRDIGCGHRCVDEVLDEYERGELKISF